MSRTGTAQAARDSKISVLIVEDDAGVSKLERRRLERAGYRVLEAASGEAAMSILPGGDVGLIVLDQRLPGGMSGLDFYIQLKSAGYDLPVIVVTGSSNEATVIQALRAGVRDYLFKSDQYLDYLPDAVGRVLKQVHAERELVESKALLAAVVGSASDAILSVDHELHVALFNPAAERLFGCAASEALHQPINRFLPGGLGAAPGESVALRADGASVPIEASVSTTQVDGRASHTIIVRDVRERNRVEAESKLIFTDRMAAVGTLAAGVAHEMNNPLAYVLANLDVIAEQLQGLASNPSPAQIQELEQTVGEARQGAERVRKIVQGLKTFSRADAEKRTRLDLATVLEFSIGMTFNEIRHRARLTREFGPVPLVLADEARLGQVFINLLVNAAQAIPEGQADRNEVRVVTMTDASGRAVVEVHDTGPGIPKALLARVFDPFFTTKPVGIGTGLGLSICHGIVTALGGEISVQSEPGTSTVFRVVVPAAGATAVPDSKRTATSRTEAGRRGSVLVVDDDALVGRAVRRVLGEHDVKVVTSGREALAELTAGAQFDVILCDLMMPEMTGMELHAEVGKARPDLLGRLVFITGGAFTPSALAFLEEVPNEQIDKPFETQSIRALVSRYCS